MTELVTRAQAFGLIAEGVAAGLSAPWRLHLARGGPYLSLDVADRAEWNAWRAHLDCAELSVRVYDAGGEIRRVSVAAANRAGYRISVELVEEVSTDDLEQLLTADSLAGAAHRGGAVG
ncbi:MULTISPECIES: hypothetical protein [Micromonospora]|uniref:hypothetical protein n=1 Tax=Micromonospora TaxID=1873 RepID=UPI000B8079D5|nr:hypothetical protein [Micromonospora yangpuensis]